jgi:hypothetical protein
VCVCDVCERDCVRICVQDGIEQRDIEWKEQLCAH